MIRLIIFSIALGVTAILLSVAVVDAYKKALSDKMSGFAGDLQVAYYDINNSLESSPIDWDNEYQSTLLQNPEIISVSPVAYKSGILKTKEEVEGIIIKGVDKNYDFDFLKEYLIEGEIPDFHGKKKSNLIIISKVTSKRLNLHLRDTVRMYFFDQENMRARGRRFFIGGIFETSLEQFDEQFLIADIRHVQKLNHWENNQISAYEVKIKDFGQIRKVEKEILQLTDYENEVRRIDEVYPALFQWLSLHDKNVQVIIGLVLMIAAITMISLLLILILEKTTLIGILKALGCPNACVRKIFIYQSVYIVGQALVYGNIFSYALIFLQDKYHFIPLDASSYYVSYVPMTADWESFLWINLGAIVLSFSVLLIPSYIITKIRPVRAIRFQ